MAGPSHGWLPFADFIASPIMLTHVRLSFVAFALLPLLGFALLAGCGGDSGPVTAESTKFKPAPAGSAKPAESAASPAEEADEFFPAAGSAKVVAGNDDGAVPTSPFADPADGKTPAAADEATGEKYAIPQGDLQTLFRFIDELGQRDPEGITRDEVLADATAIQEARLAAARRALQSGKLDDRTRNAVVRVIMQIFDVMGTLGVPDAKERYEGFIGDLAASDDPQLAEIGRLRQSQLRIQTMLSVDPPDGDAIAAEVKELVTNEKESLSAFMLASSVCHELSKLAERVSAMRPPLIELLTFLGTTYEKNEEPQVAAVAQEHQEQARAWQQDLFGKCDAAAAGEPEAGERLVAAVKELVSQPSNSAFSHAQKTAFRLETELEQYELALQVYDALAEGFAEHETKEIVEATANMAANAHKRIGLIGQPLKIDGLLINGKPFDAKSLEGKVVLVDFWATWCGPCLREFPNIRQNYTDFREQGFEVVGIGLDTNMAHLEQFFSRMQLPWTVVISQETFDNKEAPADDAEQLMRLDTHPLAVSSGVDSIPFVVLVGKDGNVDSIHVRGEKLAKRLTELLGEPAGAANPAGDKAEEAKAEDAQPAAKTDGDDAPAKEKSEEEQGGCGAEEPAAEAPADDDSQINPYSAKPGLSTADLVKYIDRMIDKPKTIQSRPGFAEALCEACDRVLKSDPPAKDADLLLAAEIKFETLHKAACSGDTKADEQLAAFCEQMKADTRPRIAAQVAFFTLERKVLEGDKLPPEEIAGVLKELEAYLAKEKLTDKHLRLASSTVALINRIENGEEREKHFVSFGNTFAKASDKELSRYGKKLAKKPAATESDLVGKEMELAGTTAAGEAFDWKKYRGKVVLVDFWATWCGPCIREMPHVREMYDKLHDQGFEIVGISLDKDREALDTFLAENQLPWETLAGDETQDLAEKYSVRGIPTMMVVDKEGKILGVAHQVAALRPIIEKALK